MDLSEEFGRIISALNDAHVDYALCGALALAVHGAPRATKDIDLLVEGDDLETVLAQVESLGYRLKADRMRFSDGMELQRVTRVEDGEFLTLDLLVVDDSTRAAWESRRVFDTEHGPATVISRDALIAMKVRAGRPQDAADVARLQQDDR